MYFKMESFCVFQVLALLLFLFLTFCDCGDLSMSCSEESSYSTYDASDAWYKSGNYFLNGMDSYHDNGKEDRKFKMKYCRPSSSSYRQLSSKQTLPYTDWDDDWIRGCGGNSGIYYVYSYHDNGKEDRRFQVRCGDVGNDVQLSNCYWYGYYPDNWDGHIHFECPNNGIMRSIDSYHHNSYEDRKYKFECCKMIESEVSVVSMTTYTSGSYSNEWDGAHDNYYFGYFLSGLYSVHDNGKEDRRFKWKYAIPSGEDNTGLSYSVLYSDYTDYDATWDASCSIYNNGHSALIRAYSVHDNGKEDRIWKFRCGYLDTDKYSLGNCAYTGHLNTWDDAIDFDCPNNGVIRSIWSQHDNGKEDRLFKFECCNVIEADYTFTNLEGFWEYKMGLSGGAGYISESFTVGISTENGQEVTEAYGESLSVAVSVGYEYAGASGGIEITGTVAQETSTTISDSETLSSENTKTVTCDPGVQYLYQFMLESDEATVATSTFRCTNIFTSPACGPGYFDCQVGDTYCNQCLDSWPTP